MIPFLSILLIFVIQCAVSLMAFLPDHDVREYWQLSYKLVYGDLEAFEIDSDPGRLFFFITTLSIPLLLLNLLIAILSDVFDAV